VIAALQSVLIVTLYGSRATFGARGLLGADSFVFGVPIAAGFVGQLLAHRHRFGWSKVVWPIVTVVMVEWLTLIGAAATWGT